MINLAWTCVSDIGRFLGGSVKLINQNYFIEKAHIMNSLEYLLKIVYPPVISLRHC